MVYNLPMFGAICKNSHFSRQIVKIPIKVCLVLCAGLIGTQN